MTPLLPDLPAARGVKALQTQLEALSELEYGDRQLPTAQEAEWTIFTQNIIERAFGNPSTSLSKFHNASRAGDLRIHRVIAYEALLRALIDTLRLDLPEEETQGVYPPGDEYRFYRDLSSLVEAANDDILIVDCYLNEDFFNLYVAKVPDGTAVRILSGTLPPTVRTVAEMYEKSRSGPFELRSSKAIHDRVLFLDSRGWVSGASLKDAAKGKPTYLVELSEPSLTALKKAHEEIWQDAAPVAKASGQ